MRFARMALCCFATLVGLAVMAGGAGTAAARGADVKAEDVALELVGQVTSTSTSSAQYGYVAFLDGLPIFNAAAESESTALLTFYADTTTLRVTNNGPLRIISRSGTFTVYADQAANGSFASPDSFRDGTPVLVATLRQQVIINTATNAFTTLNVNRVTSSAPFAVGGQTVKLGKVGGVFRTFLSGVNNVAPPPSAWMAGYTIPEKAAKKK
jgi:hypothetical protein